MADEYDKDITFVPSRSEPPRDEAGEKERDPSSLFESIFWQTLGWVHTPLFAKLDSRTPERATETGRKKKVDLKLQIEDRVPYGVLPKGVVAEIERRKFEQQDLKSILREVGIETEALLPRLVTFKDRLEILDSGRAEGIPQKPFLDLDMFDDSWYYDLYSPEEQQFSDRTTTGQAFIPGESSSLAEPSDFDWRPVVVLDYDAQKKLYLVNRETGEDEGTGQWIPRIYLKFDMEEPLHFVKRLLTALRMRHAMEESLRMTYYVDCMPLENTPDCPQHHLDAIYSTVRRSRQLQPKLKWVRREWDKVAEEIQLEYKKTFNAMCYEEMANQVPSLTKDFSNLSFPFHKRQNKRSTVDVGFPFRDRLQQIRHNTLYNRPEVVKALIMVQATVRALEDKSLYVLPPQDIYTLEKFEALQRTQLQTMKKYVHENWITDIANAISQNLESCGKGQYDLNQKAQHTLQLTKLGKLLKMVMFKMQDVIRFLVIESFEKYSSTIQTACASVMGVEDNFAWDDNLSNDKYSPLGKPLFEVPLEIKGDCLKFGVDIKKYAGLVRDLFLEGLEVTKDLPRLEKFVLKKMLYNPDDKLETVTDKERQVVNWKMNITRGMDQAIIVANSYIKAFNPLMKHFKTDQINYVKQFARKKVQCDELKKIIENHNEEKIKLENSIPTFLDIGPFRLMTKTVRTAAIKKHEQLADAVLGYFNEKLNQFMEATKDEFLLLQDKIKQPTGNIEDLLEKKHWCRTVPKKIEKLSADVNRLRSDFRLLSTFHRNMSDEDFATFWKVQVILCVISFWRFQQMQDQLSKCNAYATYGTEFIHFWDHSGQDNRPKNVINFGIQSAYHILTIASNEYPQETMKMLDNRISTFDEERNEHKYHLASDVQELQLNLEQLKEGVSRLNEYTDLKNAQTIATEVRKMRKNLIKYDEQVQLYQKKRKLLTQPQTDYPEINEMSKALTPYENFWLSAAEFYKYNERDLADLVSMDRKQLKEAIQEFKKNLKAAFAYFKEHPEIQDSVAVVLQDLKQFIDLKLSKVL